MQKYTNTEGVSLALAVWLSVDEYDHNSDPNTISVTTLLKSPRQIILSSRIPEENSIADVSTLVASRMGTAIHNAIESAWTANYELGMTAMGYPKRVIDLVDINPDPNNLPVDCIPVYMEIRTDKVMDGFTISGKFDFVAEGQVRDFKSTSTFTFTSKSNEWKQKMQGSIYRWLNQDIITNDIMVIDYIFTDWKAGQSYAKNYPKSKVLSYPIELLSIRETEAFIRDRISDIKRLWDSPESALPMCTSEDLWRKKTAYKYYKDKTKTTKKGSRSTKNFDDPVEANIKLADDGYIGVVMEVPGQVVGCKYCDAFTLCKQKDIYLADGSLRM